MLRALTVDGRNLAPPLRQCGRALEVASLIYWCRSPPSPPDFNVGGLSRAPSSGARLIPLGVGSAHHARQTILKSRGGGAEQHEWHSATQHSLKWCRISSINRTQNKVLVDAKRMPETTTKPTPSSTSISITIILPKRTDDEHTANHVLGTQPPNLSFQKSRARNLWPTRFWNLARPSSLEVMSAASAQPSAQT